MVRPRRGRDCINLSVRRFKAIVVNCNPHCPGNGNMLTTEVFGWVDPHERCQIYLDDLRVASDGFADYEVVDWFDSEYHTYDVNDFRFGADDYIAAYCSVQQSSCPAGAYEGGTGASSSSSASGVGGFGRGGVRR